MRIGIVGLGLIGGSVGLALRESGYAEQVLGFDADPEVTRIACERRAIDKSCSSIGEMGDVELLLLAVPPRSMVGYLRELPAIMSAEATISDCASIKSTIIDAVPTSIQAQFVGGHPIAGTEKVGIENASGDLFDDRQWILTPTESNDAARIKAVERLVYAVGATPVILTAEDHDRHFAILSHLPHVLANALMGMGESLEFPGIAGTSWRDLTRVGGSNPDLWAQIWTENQSEVLLAIEELQQRLGQAHAMIRANDTEGLREFVRKNQTVSQRELEG